MKKLFRGYYKLSSREIKSIWANGFISLDTNVLFDLYRYSDDTRTELLKVISKYSRQLYLTHQCAYEFHKNRISVIEQQIEIYDNTIKAIEKLEADVKSSKTPHLSKVILRKLEKTIKETIRDLERRKQFFKKLLVKDFILNTVTKVFSNKVGVGFSIDETNKIEKEGEERFRKKLPPGYKDNDKKENKFGDLILWKELIGKAKSEKRPFILISGDSKEDWWLRVQGETISARLELSQELYKESGQVFHLYTVDRFLEFASKTETIKQGTIDEVREIQSYTFPSNLNALSEMPGINQYLTSNPFINTSKGLSYSEDLTNRAQAIAVAALSNKNFYDEILKTQNNFYDNLKTTRDYLSSLQTRAGISVGKVVSQPITSLISKTNSEDTND